jgi:plasmid stability protein
MDKAPSQVIVRNLDAGVVAELKRRAKRKGRSLERELRMILTRAARPERSKLIAEADRIRAMTAGPLEDSLSLLREDRDSR